MASLFSKLKNAITGGGAKLSIMCGTPKIGEEFEVTVSAQVSDNDIKISNVYVKMEGNEVVELDGIRVAERDGDEIVEDIRTISETENTFTNEIMINGPEELKANETYEWKGTINIPEDSFPSFVCRNARHEWRILAGLDMSGNDPDTGWQIVDVR